VSDPFANERDPDELGGRFNFVAGVDAKAVWSNATGWSLETWYTVRHTVKRPHQNIDLTITRSTDPDTAIEEMETYIREARAALARLKKARKVADRKAAASRLEET
jgi:hypothetical protein